MHTSLMMLVMVALLVITCKAQGPYYSLVFSHEGWSYQPIAANETGSTIIGSIEAKNGSQLVGFNETAMRDRPDKLAASGTMRCTVVPGTDTPAAPAPTSKPPSPSPPELIPIIVDDLNVVDVKGDIFVLTGEIVPVTTLDGRVIMTTRSALTPAILSPQSNLTPEEVHMFGPTPPSTPRPAQPGACSCNFNAPVVGIELNSDGNTAAIPSGVPSSSSSTPSISWAPSCDDDFGTGPEDEWKPSNWPSSSSYVSDPSLYDLPDPAVNVDRRGPVMPPPVNRNPQQPPMSDDIWAFADSDVEPDNRASYDLQGGADIIDRGGSMASLPPNRQQPAPISGDLWTFVDSNVVVDENGWPIEDSNNMNQMYPMDGAFILESEPAPCRSNGASIEIIVLDESLQRPLDATPSAYPSAQTNALPIGIVSLDEFAMMEPIASLQPLPIGIASPEELAMATPAAPAPREPLPIGIASPEDLAATSTMLVI